MCVSVCKYSSAFVTIKLNRIKQKKSQKQNTLLHCDRPNAQQNGLAHKQTEQRNEQQQANQTNGVQCALIERVCVCIFCAHAIRQS